MGLRNNARREYTPKQVLILRRQLRCWQLRAEGKQFKQIPDILELEGLGRISAYTATKYVENARRHVMADLEEVVKDEKARQLYRLDYLFRETMAAWEGSKRDRLRTVEKMVEKGDVPPPRKKSETVYDDDGYAVVEREIPADDASNGGGSPSYTETTIERSPQVGDPRFLETARGILGDLRKVLGLDAPKQVKVSGDPDNPIRLDLFDFSKLSDDELRVAEKLLVQLKQEEQAALPPPADEPEILDAEFEELGEADGEPG